MFEIGFWELVLIGVVALIVFGPEKLPEMARTAGLWLGRGQRFLANVKRDVDRELRLQELQELMKFREQQELQKLMEETKNSLTPPASLTTMTAINPTTVPAVHDSQQPPADSVPKVETTSPTPNERHSDQKS